MHRWVAHLCSFSSTSVFASTQDLGRNVGALCLHYLPTGLACWKETGCDGWLNMSQRGISAARFGEDDKARSKAAVIRPEPIPTDIHCWSDCLVTSRVGDFPDARAGDATCDLGNRPERGGDNVQVELKYYDGETHTSPLIENPMRGGHDKLVDDILACVFGHNDLSPWQMPLCPGFLIDIAAWICPF